MNKRAWTAALVAVAMLSVLAQSPDVVANDNKERAEEWITMALAAYKAKRYRSAALAFQEAHRIDPQPRLVWNIARCFEDGKEWKDAKTWFQKFIADNKPGSPKVAEAKKRLASVDAQLAALAKAEAAKKAEESKNAELAAQRAKEREAAKKAAEERKKQEQANLAKEREELQKKIDEMKRLAAQNRELAARLEKEAAERRLKAAKEATQLGLMTNPAFNPPPPPPKQDTSMSTGGIVALVLGAAVGGVGAFLFVNGESMRGDWQDAVNTADNGIVTELTRKEALDLQDDANLQQTLGVVGIGVGSAALLTGIILLAVGDPEPKTSVSTSISDGGMSVQLQGRF